MPIVQTFVFIDLETTGLPKEELNKTKITELSLIAVKRKHLLDIRPGEAPRVQNKLTLCFNPGKMVNPNSSETTGLCNILLEHETYFDNRVFVIIHNFLNILTPPVCLIAQNGLNFDFPILKAQIEKLNMSFSDDLLCADCYHAFFDILESRKKQNSPELMNLVSTGSTELNIYQNEDVISVNMQMLNETTPKKQKLNYTSIQSSSTHRDGATMSNYYLPEIEKQSKSGINKAVERKHKARRRFPWGTDEKPTDSYKLKDIYERLLKRPAIEAHRAENDCIMALEIAVCLSDEFVKWVDENSDKFSTVRSMTIGVPCGS